MFKWMITGHKTHKKGKHTNSLNNSQAANNINNNHNQNNNINNNNNDDNHKHEQSPNPCDITRSRDSLLASPNVNDKGQRHFRQYQKNDGSVTPKSVHDSQSNSLAASRDTLDDSNEYSSLEQIQQARLDQEITIKRSDSTDQLRVNSHPTRNGHFDAQDTSGTHLTNGFVPSFPDSAFQDVDRSYLRYGTPQQPLPPLPGREQSQSTAVPQAPGTCTLPRRSLVREDPSTKNRSPSNPPPLSRQPPPYSRHQPPDPKSRIRRPCQPPPPPRLPPQTPPTIHNGWKQEAATQDASKTNPSQWKPAQQWNNKDHDSGFESLNSRPGDYQYPPSLELKTPAHGPGRTANSDFLKEALPSKSTEDLLLASRVSGESSSSSMSDSPDLHPARIVPIHPESASSLTVNKQSISMRTEVLPSDSVYPSNNGSTLVVQDTRQGHFSREDNPQMSTFKNPNWNRAALNNRDDLNITEESGQRFSNFNQNEIKMYSRPDSPQKYSETVSVMQPEYRKEIAQSNHQIQSNTAISRPINDNSSHISHDHRLYIHENEDVQTRSNHLRSSPCKTLSNDIKGWIESCSYRGVSQDEINKNAEEETGTKVQSNTAETPTRESKELKIRERNDQNRQQSSNVNRGETSTAFDSQEERRKGDGCNGPSSSSSWMEWTQQLQAYVAWVNSQLRKKPGTPLVTDLRRDFQNGVVFSDLVEIIAGEKVAGINCSADTPQIRKENLDRILQFMSLKRIRMTHITSKEIAEGNLKSIMRVILALAAHYKPQSVRANASTHSSSPANEEAGQQQQQQQQPAQSNLRVSSTTHDVGVGPDEPYLAPVKTPSLVRRPMGPEVEDPSVSVLRRQPSLTNPHRPSSPVYENLPRRVTNHRWAYDSLRASHKFHWGNSGGHPPKIPPKPPNLEQDSLSNRFSETLNTTSVSLNTSLNTSFEGDGDSMPRESKGNETKTATMDFWRDPQNADGGSPVSGSMSAGENANDAPFRYHTIHRISGRRKLPQIPGQSSSPSSCNSRGTTPQGHPMDSPLENPDAEVENKQNRRYAAGTDSLTNGDESSREPEGRSQNSSPAASIARGPVVDGWRRKHDLEPWSKDDLKDSMRDLAAARDHFFSICSLDGDLSKGGVNSGNSSLRQEVIKHILARQTLETDKMELTRHLQQKDNLIGELRRQLIHKEQVLQTHKIQLDEAIRAVHNGKVRILQGDPRGGQTREEMQLVREAIVALRSNFRGTDPNQHTLDTLEQAIAILMERGANPPAVDSNLNGCRRDKRNFQGYAEEATKVIYFTERTVTPFMSTINKRLGEVTLRDFKNMFDRPGSFRFHFKSHDPEYGLVKEEIIDDDDILPGVEGKIIAWVEEDLE